MMISVGNIGVVGAAGRPRGPRYDATAQAWFNRMPSTPSRLRRQLVNDYVVAGKDHGWFAKLDVLALIAMALDDPGYTTANDAFASRQNLKADQHNLTPFSSPVFMADRGYATDGAASFLNLNFDPSVGGKNYTQNNAAFGFWSRTAAQQAGIDMGPPVGIAALGRARSTTDNVQIRVNDGTSSPAGGNADGVGLFSFVRPSSSLKRAYKNGAQVGADIAVTTTALAAGFALGQAGGSNFSARQFAMTYVGGSLSASEISALYADTNTYLQAVGAA